jgi:hypothetical protein
VVCSVDLHAFARGLFSLTLLEGFRLGEAGNWPGAVKSIESGSVKQRAIAQGILMLESLGSVIVLITSYTKTYVTY